MNKYEELFKKQKAYSWEWRRQSLVNRLRFLDRVADYIKSHENEICSALKEDFNKPEFETLLTEVFPVLSEIKEIKKNLIYWVQAKRVETPLMFLGSQSSVYYEPKGTVLVIAPWNYPFTLALTPLVSALAAGNTVILKPSELTPKTSALLEKMLGILFDEKLVKTVEGGAEVSEELLKLPFDHVFFTGSTKVGKIVMRAAAENLSSVTLELGGKSPVVVDKSSNLVLAAQKIVWGKLLNAGQTCIAPDYLFVDEKVFDKFLLELKKQLQLIFDDKNFASIVTPRHCERLKNLLQNSLENGGQLVDGGAVAVENRFFKPTLVLGMSDDCDLMKEEIFGPLLPIKKYHKIEDVISYIHHRPKPLALYIFSKDQEAIDKLIAQTSSGGVLVNDTILHVGHHHLPFGGIGESGMGNYHGWYGFRTFSHEKAVMKQGFGGKFLKLLYPPYNLSKLKMIKWMMKLLT